ncbi:MAG: hypothetical protein K2W97_08380 [Chthoniobacterales bacterium]|nr:hypothetical protein [Chthoniobacterales bacterium]
MKTKFFFRICFFLAVSTLALHAGPKPMIEKLRRDQSDSSTDQKQQTEWQRSRTEGGDDGEGDDDEQQDPRGTRVAIGENLNFSASDNGPVQQAQQPEELQVENDPALFGFAQAREAANAYFQDNETSSWVRVPIEHRRAYNAWVANHEMRCKACREVHDYYEKNQESLYPPHVFAWGSLQTTWYEDAVKNIQLGNPKAASLALKIAALWREVEKSNQIVNRNNYYRRYENADSWIPPCVFRFFTLTETQQTNYSRALDYKARAKILEKSFKESRKQGQARGEEELVQVDTPLNFSPLNDELAYQGEIEQRCVTAQAAQQEWTELQEPDSFEKQKDFSEKAKAAFDDWHNQGARYRIIAQTGEEPYRAKFNQVADACGQVAEAIKQRLVPLQLDEELINQGHSYLEEGKSNGDKSLETGFFVVQSSLKEPFLSSCSIPPFLPFNIDPKPCLADARAAAIAYHQANQRSPWMALSAKNRQDYNDWVIQKNLKYQKAVQSRIEEIRVLDEQLESHKNAWFSFANKEELEKAKDREYHLLKREFVFIRLGGGTPEEREKFIKDACPNFRRKLNGVMRNINSPLPVDPVVPYGYRGDEPWEPLDLDF